MIEYIMLKGNLANAITVLSAHFLIVRLLIHFIPEDNGQSYLFEKDLERILDSSCIGFITRRIILLN